MRRSRAITLVLIGSAAAALTLPALLGEAEPEAQYFASREDCAALTGDGTACAATFTEAEALHTETAPRYTDRASCVAAHGPEPCQSATVLPNGLIVPAMAGVALYALARAGGQDGRVWQPYPVTRQRDDSASIGGFSIGNFSGAEWRARADGTGGYQRPRLALDAGARTAVGGAADHPASRFDARAGRATPSSHATAAASSIARGGFGTTGRGTAS